MAFEKWKQEDGSWGDEVVTVVACCGVLLLIACYFVFSNGLETKLADRWRVPTPPATTIAAR